MSEEREKRDKAAEFAERSQEKERGVIAEFVAFLREEQKWWLTPIIVVLLLLGLLVVLASTGAAPFIYTLF